MEPTSLANCKPRPTTPMFPTPLQRTPIRWWVRGFSPVRTQSNHISGADRKCKKWQAGTTSVGFPDLHISSGRSMGTAAKLNWAMTGNLQTPPQV